MTKRAIPLAMLIVLASVASPAYANFYAGASYLQTDAEFEDAANEFDADDSSFKIFGGFNFGKFLGIEASYRDLGNQQDSAGAAMLDVDLEAYDISARGTLPIGKLLGIFAKVGYANIAIDGNIGGGSIDDDDWELLYGVGLDVYLGKRFGVRGEWEEYDVEDSLNSLSVGAFIRF
jgi:hypothetical protein